MCNLIHTHNTLHAHRNLQSEFLNVVLLDQRVLFKAVVKFEHPRIPAFQPFMKPVSYFLRKQFHAVQCLYQL